MFTLITGNKLNPYAHVVYLELFVMFCLVFITWVPHVPSPTLTKLVDSSHMCKIIWHEWSPPVGYILLYVT